MRFVSGLVYASASAVAVLIAGGASAADMPEGYPTVTLPPRAVERPAARPEYVSSGWYLRGDLGYRFGTNSGADSASGFANPVSDKMDNVVAGGLGFGIKTDWLRTDLTADYAMPMKYTATIASPDDTSAKIAATTILFNGYIDLGTWYRMTPYIGAGAGVAYVQTTEYQSTAAPPFTADTSNNKWNFAWAAMAGLGYQIGPNLMADIGYRYINLGDATTGSDAFGSMTVKNVAAHEIRVGLRWSFDDYPGHY